MQFRERGKQILVIKTTYDPAIKRGVAKTIATMKLHTPNTEQIENWSELTDEERREIEEWLANRHAESERKKHEFATLDLAYTIRAKAQRVAAARAAGHEIPNLDEVKEAIIELKRAIGLPTRAPRPKTAKPRKSPPQAHRQIATPDSDQAGTILDDKRHPWPLHVAGDQPPPVEPAKKNAHLSDAERAFAVWHFEREETAARAVEKIVAATGRAEKPMFKWYRWWHDQRAAVEKAGNADQATLQI